MFASVIINEVATILNDMEVGHEHVRWPEPELINYMNEAIAAIAIAKPTLFTITTILPLGPGSTQRLPDTFNRILDIHFNLNKDGSEGPNVLPGVYNLQQAFQKPGCPTDAVIETYAAYPGSERFFWVDPPVPNNLSYTPKVQALVVMTPQVLTDPTEPVIFPGGSSALYQAAISDWLFYRCYSKDEESATSFERSLKHLNAFQTYLGVAVGYPQQSRKSSGQPMPRQQAAA